MSNTTSTVIFMASSKHHIFRAIVGVVSVIGLGLWLYAPSRELLLFWDDVPHMQWLAGKTGGQYWFTSAGFPFYRPATFAIWEISEAIFGRHDARWLHMLSVGLHICNALLLMVVVAQVVRTAWAGVIAALLFLTFPFSYQTVIPTAAHFHLWLVFGLLGASVALLYWYRQPQHYSLLIIGWLLGFWAAFSHENGVLAPILVGGIIWLANTEYVLAWRQLYWRRMILAVGPIAGFAALYLLAWLLVPKANDDTGLKLTALDVKVGQTLQAFGYPFAAAIQSFTDVDDVVGAWLAGGIGLALLGLWLLVQPIQRGRVGLMAVWGFVVMLPAWLFLDAGYLLGSPRLHYLASVGIAALWGSALARPFPHKTPMPAQWVGCVVGVGACLVIAVPFIQARLDEHQVIDDLYRDTGAIADDMRDGQRLLLVNGPAYIAPREGTFPLGAEGSTYLPDFINLGDWLALNGYRSVDADIRRADDIIPQTELRFAVTHPALDRATVSDYNVVAHVLNVDDELVTMRTGIQVVALPRDPIATYTAEGIEVLDMQLHEDGGHYYLRLDWRTNTQSSAPMQIFVHMTCGGAMVAQADGPPVGRMYPFELWGVDVTWRDFRVLVPERSVTTECIGVLVGLYNPTTGERYRVQLASGAFADGIYIAIG